MPVWFLNFCPFCFFGMLFINTLLNHILLQEVPIQKVSFGFFLLALLMYQVRLKQNMLHYCWKSISGLTLSPMDLFKI